MQSIPELEQWLKTFRDSIRDTKEAYDNLRQQYQDYEQNTSDHDELNPGVNMKAWNLKCIQERYEELETKMKPTLFLIQLLENQIELIRELQTLKKQLEQRDKDNSE